MNEDQPLGWIEPENRTPEQEKANAAALATMSAFALPPVATAGPVKVMLTEFWKNKDVVADVGFEFNGFRQLTGACVGVSLGNGVFTLSAIQRTITENPTRAFVPWWPFVYGRTRWNEGDRGQGEGAVVSIAGRTLKDGVFGIDEIPDEPQFSRTDGLAITRAEELRYSDGNYAGNTKYIALAKQHPVGTIAPLFNIEQVKTAILNGYPVVNGCSYYIGNGSLSGDVALGTYDGRGGHATGWLGYWDHTTHGPLYLYSNQWAGNTYPQDSSGKARCTVWVKEANAAKLFTLGGGNGETFAMSSLNYFPAQPAVLDWFVAP